MTNNVRDTDDGRVWGSSHCLLRKERIWRGGSKTFLLNIFLNIFALSNFTHNSTLFFFVKYCHKVFFLECFQPIFFTFEPASTSTGYWFIITNTKFMTLAFPNSIFDQVELRGGFWFDEAFVLHAWERLAEFVFVFVLLFVFVLIPLIRQVCCSSVSGLQSISWWVVGAHQREVDDDPPANWRNHRTIALSHRSHSTTGGMPPQ